MPQRPAPQDIDKFILDHIETVPHLEALLLAWSRRPRSWSVEEMARALYIPPDLASKILQDLAQEGLLKESTDPPAQYAYIPGSEERDQLIAAVESTYRRELVRVSRMIHAKAPYALREFARAFRITKEKEKD
jgi:DNA-binding MarR family transcriptional regulator